MKENTQTKPVVQDSPAQMIQAAVAAGANLDQLEKLLTLQERWEANEARKAFNKSMAEFKANPPAINKDKEVNYGNTHYKRASLANVVDKITSAMSKYGLSATWRTQQNGRVVVTCRISHVMGHYEETSLSAESDKSGSKNPIQAIGSAVSYLQRYTLLAITGLAAHDQPDDDGRSAFVSAEETIGEKELNYLYDGLNATGSKEEKLCEYLKIESWKKCQNQNGRLPKQQ